ncbi:MAG: DUF721 domain-containing protein, partial [Candidatus Omnitrophica bacterium]|nr:DUF721 domain-containing protein [Candidatus Omnitrophota bacterium]
IDEAWRRAAGDDAAKHSKPTTLKKAVITVSVDSSSWLYELTMRKKEILNKLEKAIPNKKIKDVRFRIGNIK